MVVNPARRSLSIGGARQNPSRKPRRRRSTRRRSNPVVRKIASTRRRSNPRRVLNPISSVSGLLAAAIFTGVGVSIFDVIVQRVAPQSQGLMRTGIKAGGAYAFLTWGDKVPVLKKYKNEIALVLGVSAAIDVMKLYVFPLVYQTAASFGLNLNGGGNLQQLPNGDDGGVGSIYANANLSPVTPWYS